MIFFLFLKFFEADPRFYPERTTYSQVSSTTGNQGLLVQARERHSPGSGHSTPSRGHTPLVFSLTQLQGSGGLVVLNSNSGPTSTTSSMSPYNRIITPPVSDTPSPRPLMSSCEPPSDIGSATRGEVGSVSAAVNTLTNIHEFSLDLHNGNYDSVYSGLQPVTDSLLSGPESKKSDEDSNKSDSDGGPLLDFKTAFSDLDNKNDMSFLHETLDMTHDDIHRTLSANLPSCQQEKVRPTPQAANHMQNGHNNHSGHQMEYQDHTQQHQHHHQQQQQQSHHNNSFDVNLDAFDILSDFPELSGYESNVGGNTNGLIHNGSQSPMLSQSAASVAGVGAANTSNHIGGSIKARTLEYRENLVSISDYSPGWAYTNVSTSYYYKIYEKIVSSQPSSLNMIKLTYILYCNLIIIFYIHIFYIYTYKVLTCINYLLMSGSYKTNEKFKSKVSIPLVHCRTGPTTLGPCQAYSTWS